MCGIAGYVGSSLLDISIRNEDVLAKLKHRGPDGYGIETVESGLGRALLFHTRLAIIDISPSGSQPMVRVNNKNGLKLTVTFNGEIFNYRELRAEIETLGYRFNSSSDTEVILGAYVVWGESAFQRLRGMYSFALADPEKNKIYLVRDPVGIKPLYFHLPNLGGISFSSEVRALKVLPGGNETWKIRPGAIHSFLAQGMVIGNNSIIEGIQELDPGHMLVLNFHGQIIHKNCFTNEGFNEGSFYQERGLALVEIKAKLFDSIKRHTISDVPVGLFLSSGIDSTALAFLTAELNCNLKALSVGFDIGDADESIDAGIIAKKLGIKHQTSVISGSFVLSSIDSVFKAMDQPTVDGFNSFFVCKAAKEAGFKVALSGLGGDEVFGGYASFRDVGRARRLARFTSLWKLGQFIENIGKKFGKRSIWKAGRTYLYPNTITGMYFLRRELFSPLDRLSLLGVPDSNTSSFFGIENNVLEELEREIKGMDIENSVGFLEQKIYMRNMLLRDSDVFSMANALEIRVPLLDLDLINLVNQMPGKWKRPGKKTKALLVDSFGKIFPNWVQGKKKRGFSFPWGSWIRGPLRSFMMERLFSNSWEKLDVKKELIGIMWNRFEAGDPSITPLGVLALVVLAEYIYLNDLAL
jgi:asparagine synthase (glutamine-hydrolysing)